MGELVNSITGEDPAVFIVQKDGERGPQGPKGPKGDDGAIHYTAGDNIKISDDNVISSKDTTYTAGGHISISAENVVSATYTNATTSADGLMSKGDKAKLDSIFAKIYPVGSIYMSVNSTSPATLFGGTWTQLKDRFLVGAGSSYSNGATGGATTHSHGAGSLISDVHVDGSSVYVKQSSSTFEATHARYQEGGKTIEGKWGSNAAVVEGSTASASSLPPYLAVYMWKRTA